jgi:tetratricopeptide (TPR) repeat protein
MMFLPALFLTITTAMPEVHLTTQQQNAVLEEAQQAYAQGIRLLTTDTVASKESFRRAANRFRLLVDDGIENGKLWYDLGNAELQSGEIGEAIAAYRSAQRYIPSDGRLAGNLEYARSQVVSSIERENTTSMLKRFAFWHTSLPTQVRLSIGMILWFAFWAFITIRFFKSIPGFKSGVTALGVAAIALGVSVGTDIADQHKSHGVLTAKDVVIRKGHGENYAPLINDSISEGIEFDILGKRSNWLHIRLPNGQEGWINQKDAQVVSLDSPYIQS